METGLDRAIDHLAANADDKPAQQRWVNRQVNRNFTANPLTKRLLQRGDLIIGKGVGFMEDKSSWHGVAPDDDQLAVALAELGAAN